MIKIFNIVFLLCSVSYAGVNAENGVALGGADVVAYFDKGRTEAVAGSKDFSHEHQGVKYLFSSSENLEKFKASPEDYLPAYGGYCAWAVEDVSKYDVPVNNDYFIIDTDSNGKKRLLLFYKKFFTNTKKMWNKKASKTDGGSKALISSADKKWATRPSSSQK